jgi:uncharacterized membrane protein
MIIILTPEQANYVRGPSEVDEKSILIPIATTDGNYILDTLVLDDPAHINHKEFLSTLPQITIETYRELYTETE